MALPDSAQGVAFTGQQVTDFVKGETTMAAPFGR